MDNTRWKKSSSMLIFLSGNRPLPPAPHLTHSSNALELVASTFKYQNVIILKNIDLFFQKNKPKGQIAKEEAESKNLPKTFVMHRGDVGKSILQLEMDIRHVMEPNTAVNLKVNKLSQSHFLSILFKYQLLKTHQCSQISCGYWIQHCTFSIIYQLNPCSDLCIFRSVVQTM